MNFRFNKTLLLKLAIILLLFSLAPYAVPFSIEFILMADVLGLEALILFLMFQSRLVLNALRARLIVWFEHMTATVLLLAGLYIFQPGVLISHVAGSSMILFLACSILMALALWIPALYLSSSGYS